MSDTPTDDLIGLDPSNMAHRALAAWRAMNRAIADLPADGITRRQVRKMMRDAIEQGNKDLRGRTDG